MTRSRRERSIPAGEFKAKCLSLLDEVETRGHTIVVTKRGRPVARVVPLPKAGGDLIGSLLHEEDLAEPLDVTWEADT
ncbi:MAG: type II toxin-antitoxin system Phd/YefM family antitoxin [Sandaracinaceae bacterium]|nr:type II toxin-antitoxin system Phd/YefM family antitoxin [Sandaracinaceae bacterium]